MANTPSNVTIRADLATYAFAVMQDAKKALDLCNLLAPVVQTGGTSGLYNKFDTTASFKAWANAQRPVGGKAQSIEFLSETANYNAKPYGLRISIDKHERAQAGGAETLLEQGKVRTLTIQSILAHLSAISTKILAGVSASANVGEWSNANTDPIAELDAQALAMWNAAGVLPNNLVIDFGAWVALRNNPLVIARMPGKQVSGLAPEDLTGLLAAPSVKVTVAETAVLTGGGLGNANATKTGAFGKKALLFHSSPNATQYDPSFAKTFAPSAGMFTAVQQYRDEPNLDWYENDWTADVQVVSALLCKRIDVT